jgi:hypothetical protein
LFGFPGISVRFEKDGRRGDSASRIEEHVNGLEYIKGVLEVVVRVLMAIDMSHIEK